MAEREFGTSRDTLVKRARALSLEPGADGCYSSRDILRAMIGDDNTEAVRALNVARRQQIELEMEVTRKERIPLDVIEEVNTRALSNVAGVLKAHVGKTFDDAALQDIFTELRGVGERLSKAFPTR